MTGALLPRLMALGGLLSLGQGLLVVLGVLDHEAPLVVGAALLLVGAVLVVPSFSSAGAATVAPGRARLVATLGLALVVGLLAYNVARASTLSAPEVSLVGYGALLALAAPWLGARAGPVRVGTLVAYSFPLVLVPLGMWAVNAAIEAGVGGTPLDLYVRYGLVAPMAGALSALGVGVRSIGETVALATPRGEMFLTVGVVCAGLYATAIFLGIFALFAWEQRVPPKRLAAYLAVGLVGLHVANVARLVLLAVVGERWGAAALQDFHRHAGWVLFLAWTLLFWAVVLRRFERPRKLQAA